MCGWGAVRCSSSVPGGSSPCGMVFSTVSSVPPREAARAVSGPNQEPRNQSGHCRAIGCARRTHTSSSLLATLLLPEIVHTALLLPEIAHTADRTSVKYPTSPERRAPTIRVGACLLPRHGPHAEVAGSLLELREAFRSKRRPQRLTHASDIAWWAR